MHDDMFHTLSDVQRGESVSLQQYIDNRDGHLRIGLKSITFTVGWYNIHTESVSWVNAGGPIETMIIPPGLYGLTDVQTLLEMSITGIHLEVSETSGLIELTIDHGWSIQLTDGLGSLLGLDDGLGGVWLEEGVYHGDRPVNFTPTNSLQVHLGQLSTSTNYVDGAPSTLLAVAEVECTRFGTTNVCHFECPLFKHLVHGTSHELKITIRDAKGKVLDNHSLPISLVLEVR